MFDRENRENSEPIAGSKDAPASAGAFGCKQSEQLCGNMVVEPTSLGAPVNSEENPKTGKIAQPLEMVHELSTDDNSELERLRILLFSEERLKLNDLQQRILDPHKHAQELSAVISEAMLLRTDKDKSLGTVLAPTVEHIFRNYLRKNPVDLAEGLFPVIGPAIRRSIVETFRGMLQSFSNTVEMSLSWRGLRWRFEALRTGKPFSEVVLLHNLIYLVEEIYFIHTETGLVLDHLVNNGIDSQDADLVSGMFTAIQDFVRDCFAGDGSGDIESLQLDGRTIFVARRGRAYAACVVRGTPPAQLAGKLRIALNLAMVECSELLDDFSGDTAPFARSRRFFEPLMVSHYVEAKKLPFLAKLVPASLMLALICGFVYIKHQEYTWRGYIEGLYKSPGIAVTTVESSWFGLWKIDCMKDLVAEDPLDFLIKSGMPRERINMHVTPYLSLDNNIVRTRVLNSVSNLPDGVVMHFVDSTQTIVFEGTANMDRILTLREKALAIPGVRDVDISKLKDPRSVELDALANSIEGTVVRFEINKDIPLQDDKALLENAVSSLQKLDKLAQGMGMSVSLIIYGHTDAIGSSKRNYELSQERARVIAAMLYAKGVAIPVATYGMGSEYASKSGTGIRQDSLTAAPVPATVNVQSLADPESRKIELRVNLTRIGESFPLRESSK